MRNHEGGRSNKRDKIRDRMRKMEWKTERERVKNEKVR